MLVSVERYLKGLMDERDCRYEQRWKAQERAVAEALRSQQELVAEAVRIAREAAERSQRLWVRSIALMTVLVGVVALIVKVS